MRILLLDDDDRVRFNLKLFLIDEGIDCVDYINAESALEALESERFDVAIVDIRLPGKNGEEFIFAAKKAAPSLHFIIHTGTANYKLPTEIISMGIPQDAVMYKPVDDMDLLLQTIKRLYAI